MLRAGKKLLPLLLFGTITFCLAACEKSLDDQQKSLDKFVKNNKYGSSSDVWLLKLNAFGEQEKVALVFGFMDDLGFCREIAELYMKKYPKDKYSCIFAN